MSDEYLWPEAGHRFFEFSRTQPDAYTWIDRSLSEYAFMYRESADLLTDTASEAPGLLYALAILAVYLFRRFVELSLKSLLVTAGQLAGQAGTFADKHSLVPLWSSLRHLRVAETPTSDDDLATFDAVEAMIGELDAIDGTSTAFRYPIGRARKVGTRPELLADDFEYFDMRAFRRQAERLANSLSAAVISWKRSWTSRPRWTLNTGPRWRPSTRMSGSAHRRPLRFAIPCVTRFTALVESAPS